MKKPAREQPTKPRDTHQNTGGPFAQPFHIVTPNRSSLDDKPGPLPEITSDDESVTFEMLVLALGQRARLRVRCDVRGGIWLRIGGPDSKE